MALFLTGNLFDWQHSGPFALPAARYGLERCGHNLKPRKPRVYKIGLLLSRHETPTKQNDAPEPISGDLSAYTGVYNDAEL